MALHLDDPETTRLVGALAGELQTSKEVAVRRVVEAALEKLSRERTFDQRLDEFYKRLGSFLQQMAFEIVPIGADEAVAFEASYLYGRDRHPATLKMGDCFGLHLCEMPRRTAAIRQRLHAYRPYINDLLSRRYRRS